MRDSFHVSVALHQVMYISLRFWQNEIKCVQAIITDAFDKLWIWKALPLQAGVLSVHSPCVTMLRVSGRGRAGAEEFCCWLLGGIEQLIFYTILPVLSYYFAAGNLSLSISLRSAVVLSLGGLAWLQCSSTWTFPPDLQSPFRESL